MLIEPKSKVWNDLITAHKVKTCNTHKCVAEPRLRNTDVVTWGSISPLRF